jgi:hypothetical protein
MPLKFNLYAILVWTVIVAIHALPWLLISAFVITRIAYRKALRQQPGSEKAERLRTVSGIVGLVMAVVLLFYLAGMILLGIALQNM